MADKIKKFFKKKKLDAKFKAVGPGHKLTDNTSSGNSSKKRDYVPPPPRSGLTSESKQAAAAALARLQGQQHDAVFNTSLLAIRAQVRKEMEAESKKTSEDSADYEVQEEVVELDAAPLLATQGIYFKCPNISPEVLSKEEWNIKIKEFLLEQLLEERGLTACLMVHTLNKNKEKVQMCVETIIKYLENILQHPTEDKFRKIRMSNRIYEERVKSMDGALEVLEAAGFERVMLPFQDGEEQFLVFDDSKLDQVEILMDALRSAEPISLELDRNLRVLLPSQARSHNQLPPAFYNLTPEELKKEQQSRSESLDRNQMLRTKAMREKEELREMKKYRFALIRIRFPDGIMLQGTFGVYEKLSAVLEFVRENLEDECMDFTLATPTGQQLSAEQDGSLMDLRLVPATVLTFSTNESSSERVYLKPDVLILVQSLSLS